jgi:hypothetical protein
VRRAFDGTCMDAMLVLVHAAVRVLCATCKMDIEKKPWLSISNPRYFIIPRMTPKNRRITHDAAKRGGTLTLVTREGSHGRGEADGADTHKKTGPDE